MRTFSAKPRSSASLRKEQSADPESDLLLLHNRLKDVVSGLIEYADLTDTFLSSRSPPRSLLDKLTIERTKWENYMIYALGVKEVALRRRFHMPTNAFEGDFGKVTEILANAQTRLSATIRKGGFDPGNAIWEAFSELNQRFWDQFFAGKRTHSDEIQIKTGLLEEQEIRINQLKEQLKSAELGLQSRDQTISQLQFALNKPNSPSQPLIQTHKHAYSRPPSPPKPQDRFYFTQKVGNLAESPVNMRMAASGTLDLRSLKEPLERVMQERDQLKGMITRSKSPVKSLESAESEHFAEKQRLRAVIADLRRQLSDLKGSNDSPSKPKPIKPAEELLKMEKERSQAIFKALKVKEKEQEEMSNSYKLLQEELISLKNMQKEGKLQEFEVKRREEQAEKMVFKAQNDLERTNNMLKALKDDKELQIMEIKQLKAANGVLDIKNQRSLSKITTLERKLSEKTEELAAIQEKIQELDEIQVDFQSISTLKAHISDLESANSQLSASLKACHTQLQSTIETLEDLRREEEEVRGEVRDFQERWEGEEKAVQTRVLAVEKRLKGAEIAVKAAKERKRFEGKFRAENDALASENEVLKGKVAVLEREIQAKSTAIQSQSQALTELKTLKQLNLALTHSQSEEKRLSEALEQANAELKTIKGEASAAQQRESSAQTAILALKEELNEVKSELIEAKESLEREKTAWKRVKTAQKEQLRTLKSDLSAVQQSIKSKDQELSQLQEALSAANRKGLQGSIEELESQLKRANEDLEYVQQEKESARIELQVVLRREEESRKTLNLRLEGEQEKALEAQKTLEDRISAFERENLDLKDNALATAQKVHSLQQDLKAKTKQISLLTAEKIELEKASKAPQAAENRQIAAEADNQIGRLKARSDLEALTAILCDLEAIAGVDTTEKLSETLISWRKVMEGVGTFLQEHRGKIAGETLEALGGYVKGLENEQAYLKTRVKAQREEMEAEMGTLRQRLTIMEEENEGLERTISKVKGEMQQNVRKYEEIIANLTGEREKLKAQLAETVYSRQTAESDEKEANELKLTAERMQDIANALKEAKAEKLAADLLVERLKSDISALTTLKTHTEKQIQDCNAANTHLSEEIANLQRENAELKQKSASQLAQAEETKNALEKAINEQKNAAFQAKNSMEIEQKRTLDAKKTVEEDVKLLESELKAAEKDLRSSQEDLSQSQELVISLQLSNQQAQEAISRLSTEKEALENRLKGENDAFAAKMQTIQDQFLQKSEEISLLNSVSSRFQAENERFQGLLSVSTAQIEALEGEKGKLEAGNKRLSQDLIACKQRETELLSELQRANSHIKASQSSLEHDLQEAKIALLAEKRDKEDLKTALRAAEEGKTTLEIDCKQRETALEASKSALEQVKSDLLEYKQRVKAAAEEKSRVVSAISEREKEIIALKEQINNETANYQRKFTILQQEKANKDEEIARLQGQIEVIRREKVTLEDSAGKLMTISSSQREKDAQIEALRREIGTITAEIAVLQGKKTSSDESTKRLISENQLLNDQLKQSNTHQESLQARIAALEAQLAALTVVEEAQISDLQLQEMELAAGLPVNMREIELSTERENVLEEEMHVPVIYYSAEASERAKQENMKRIAAVIIDLAAKLTDKMSLFLTKIPAFLTKISLLEHNLSLANRQIVKLKADFAVLQHSQQEEDEVSNPEAPRPSLSPETQPCVLVHYESRAWVLLRSATGELTWQEQGPQGIDYAPVVLTQEGLIQIGKLMEERKLLHYANAELEEKLAFASEELHKIRELLESRGFNFQGESLFSVINSISLPRKRGPSKPNTSEAHSEVSSSNKDHLSPQKAAINVRAVTSPLGNSEKMSESGQSKALSEEESQHVFRTINKLMKDNDDLVKELTDSQRQKELYKARLAEIESRQTDPVSSSEVVVTVQNLLEILPPM